MIFKASILSKTPADFIVQLRFKELQKISHKQPLKKNKTRFCIFGDSAQIYPTLRVTCAGNKRLARQILRLPA